LTRGFPSADDQFQALQTQVTEGFQPMDFRLQEQEAEVAQIQINVRNTIHHLMPEDKWDLEHCGFLLSSYGYLSFCWDFLLLSLLFWILELFVCGLLLRLPFVLLRQKWGVLFLDRISIFNRSSDFCPIMAKWGVC
jgi:hypothetical protein